MPICRQQIGLQIGPTEILTGWFEGEICRRQIGMCEQRLNNDNCDATVARDFCATSFDAPKSHGCRVSVESHPYRSRVRLRNRLFTLANKYRRHLSTPKHAGNICRRHLAKSRPTFWRSTDITASVTEISHAHPLCHALDRKQRRVLFDKSPTKFCGPTKFCRRHLSANVNGR